MRGECGCCTTTESVNGSFVLGSITTGQTYSRGRRSGWRRTGWSAPRFTSSRRIRERRCSADGGRDQLLHRDWSMYDTAHAVFRPRHMSAEVEAGYAWIYRQLFSMRRSGAGGGDWRGWRRIWDRICINGRTRLASADQASSGPACGARWWNSRGGGVVPAWFGEEMRGVQVVAWGLTSYSREGAPFQIVDEVEEKVACVDSFVRRQGLRPRAHPASCRAVHASCSTAGGTGERVSGGCAGGHRNVKPGTAR